MGTFIYGELVSPSRLTGFIFVWVALAVFSADSLVNAKRGKAGTKPAVR